MTKTIEISGHKIRTASRAAYLIVGESVRCDVVGGELKVVERGEPFIIGYAYSVAAAEKRARRHRGTGTSVTIHDIRGDDAK